MKKHIFILLTLALFSFISYSQVNGRAVYESVLVKNGYAPIKEELLFQEYKSTYQLLEKENPDKIVENNETGGVTINTERPDSIHPFIIMDFKKKQIFSRVFLTFDNGETYTEYYTREDFGINWDLYSDTLTIQNFPCKKATTRFRGRNYIAWYTEQIPLSLGPWKFHGLPGLIVQIHDDQREVNFALKEIEIPYIKNLDIGDSLIYVNAIPIKKYGELRDQAEKESSGVFRRKLMSKLPRGAVIELTDEDTNDIEKEFK